MPHKQPGQSRRQFIKRTGAAAAVAGAGLFNLPVVAGESKPIVSIVVDPQDAVAQQLPAQWAVQQLRDALNAHGVESQLYEHLDQAPAAQECILVAAATSNFAQQICQACGLSVADSPESFALARGNAGSRPVLLASASDARGLVYALLELADRVQFPSVPSAPLVPLKSLQPACQRPANAIRGVARPFASDVEDKPWYNDREYWTRFLTMLATHRFNRFHLMLGVGYDFTTDITDCYFHFAYPFLLTVPGYNVRAVPLPDSERDANLEQLRFISDEAARRGLHFQLGVWTHAYLWTDSPRANYLIEGLTPETHAPYCRDALCAVLKACPNIRGVTLRTHGESGVAEGSYDLWKTIMDGVVQCGRPMEIDLHAKGLDQQMIDVALATGMKVNISPKFWAEHMGLPYLQGAIRPQEMPPRNALTNGFFSRSTGTRSFLRYGYGDLYTEERRYSIMHRVWPGTQRLLAWSDLDMTEAYGRVSSFCGSAGLELMEPLSFKGRKGSGLPGGRNAYADESLKPAGGDFEKYLQTYRIWGRSLFNPDGDADGKRRWLRNQFGRGAVAMEAALASAGKILPLVTTAHCPSAANNNYWPEMYCNMPMVDVTRRHPYSDTPSPKRLGTVAPLDPEFFLSLDEFADELLHATPSGKYTPAWVATQLDDAARNALTQLRQAKSKSRDWHGPNFRRLAVDVTLQAGLGKFYAAKFRSGVLYGIYLRTNHLDALQQAIALNRASRDAWSKMAAAARGVYRDDVTFGPEYFQHGNWQDRIAAMDADLADMEKVLAEGTNSTNGKNQIQWPPQMIELAMEAACARPPTVQPPGQVSHTPPQSFQRGQPLPVVVRAPSGHVSAIQLRFRHVNQSESWHSNEMHREGDGYHTAIAAEYADSPFPLQYHFQILSLEKTAWLYPGLQPGWQGQPYFVVRQAS